MGQSHSRSSAQRPPSPSSPDAGAAPSPRRRRSLAAAAAKRGGARMRPFAKKMRRVAVTVTPAVDACASPPKPKPRRVTSEGEGRRATTGSSTVASAASPRLPASPPSLALRDSYRILPKVVGVGVAGEVRRCVHLPTSELRAVKTIAKRRVRRPDRLRREVGLLRELDHPNIISFKDAYDTADETHIVTELCRGGELYDRIQARDLRGRARRRLGGKWEDKGPACFREDEAARVLRALLAAVAHLHARDIVHRDVKPENVLFAEAGDDAGALESVRLIDFGLAVRHPEGQNSPPLRTVVGTSYYMAPEVLAGRYGRACDLWSIGVIAYTMLAGRPPFNGPSNDVIFDRIQEGRYRMDGSTLWRGVSASARDFVRGLLAMNPARRPTAEEALAHPWLNRSAAADEAAAAPSP